MAKQLEWPDLAVVAGMLALSWAVGLYYGFCKKRIIGSAETNAEDRSGHYLVGNRKVGVVPSALSIAATTMSGSAIVGVVSEVYLYGAQYAIFAFGALVAMVFVAIAVVPVYRRLQYISIYEYLEKRYDKYMRRLFSILYIIARVGFSSVILYVPALCLMTLSGIPYWLSILVSGCVCTLYCTVGGIKAVIWTDVIQSAFMVVCNVLVIYFGIVSAGGWTPIWDRAIAGDRIGHLTLLESPTTRYSVWSLFFGGFMVTMAVMVSSQAGIQRILCVREIREAQMATVLSGFLITGFLMSSIVAAIVIYSNFAGCDPLLQGTIKDPDQLILVGITEFLSLPGLKGLALSGILSGALSSFSSLISAFATLTVEDFLAPLLAHRTTISGTISDTKKLLLCKITTLCYGALCMLVAFLIPQLGGINKASIQILGSIGGPLTAGILLGMLSRKANSKGVFIGLTLGLAFNIWVFMGSAAHPRKMVTLQLNDEGCDFRWDYRSGRKIDFIPEFNWTVPGSTTRASQIGDEKIATTELYSDFLSAEGSNFTLPDFQPGIEIYNSTTDLDGQQQLSTSTEEITTEQPDFISNKTSDFLNSSHFSAKRENDIFPIYTISYMWYGPLGFLITFWVGLVFSEVVGSDPNSVDPRLLSPLVCDKSELQPSCEQNVRLLIGKRMCSRDSVGTTNDTDNLTTSDVDETSRV